MALDAKATRIWLEKICGPEAVDFAAMQRDQEKRDEIIASETGGEAFEQLKQETKEFMLSLEIHGKNIKRPKVMRGTDAKAKFGEMDLEFDTGGDSLDGAQFTRDGKKVEEDTFERFVDPLRKDDSQNTQLLLDLKKVMGPLMEKSQKMAEAIDSEGKRLFTDAEIEAQLWMPLVREGIIPSNLVPDAFSQTVQALEEGNKVYKRLMEREEGRSMSKDTAGTVIRGLKHFVNIGKTVGGEILRYEDLSIVEASRQDLAQFFTGRNKLDITDEEICSKLGGLRGIETTSGECLPDPEGMTEQEYDAAVSDYFSDNETELKALGIGNKEDLEEALGQEPPT